MNVFLALLGDAWRESRDKRAIQVLIGLCLVVVVVFASMSFERAPIADTLTMHARNLDQTPNVLGHFRAHDRKRTTRWEVTEPRARAPEDDLPLGDDLEVVEFTFKNAGDLDALVKEWNRAKKERHDQQHMIGTRVTTDAEPVDRQRFFVDYFTDLGYEPVHVRSLDDGGERWRVAVGVARPVELVGSCKLVWAFGMLRIDLDSSEAEFLASLESGVANLITGFLGLLILLTALSSAVPELLQKGRLDLVLARPIGRARLLVLRYFGTVLVVFCLWTLLFGGSTVALGWATGFWNPAFILCALTGTAIFAVLYPVAVWIGTLTRAAGLSALAAMGTWALQSAITAVKDMLGSGMVEGATRWHDLVDALYWIVPKVSDLTSLNTIFLAHSNLSPAAYDRSLAGLVSKDVDWWYSGGTSALFAAVVLALACWRFRRRDW